MGEKLKQSEVERRIPFKIRGHHTEAGPFGWWDELFKNTIPDAKSVEVYVSKDLKNLSDMSKTPDKQTQEYAKDILGGELLQPGLYMHSQLLLINEFISLPNDYPILISTELDGICNTCIIGDHCHDPKRIEYDKLYITLFEEYLQNLGYSQGNEYGIVIDRNNNKSISITKELYLQALSSISEYIDNKVDEELK